MSRFSVWLFVYNPLYRVVNQEGGNIMFRRSHMRLALLASVFCMLIIGSRTATSAQEAKEAGNPRGTLKVVDFLNVAGSVTLNYAEGLVELDKDNNFVPCLAESWNWIDERTIEFKLRRGVSFQNGEPFNAESVRLNWKAYKKLKTPTWLALTCILTGTDFKIVDDYTVRFIFPEPDGMALVRIRLFYQFAPTFFAEHEFREMGWGALSEPGPWGTGPFKLVEGGPRLYGGRVVLEAYEKYWDKRYPKVKTLIFDNTLLKNREEAVKLCRETEGKMDIVSFIRPIDTLKVAESPFAKVVKSKDFTQTHSAINQRKKNSKWRDIRLRKALSHAINREELLEYGAKGNAYNLGGHIPPGARGHNPNLALYTYDTTKAKALLAEAGYSDGFEMTLITPEAQELEAQVMKRMYERIGLKVKLEVFPYPVWMRKVWYPTEALALKQEWDVSVCYNNDSSGHSGVSHLVVPYLDSSNMRWIEYDAVYEEMWEDMAKTVDEAAQDEKMRQMEQYVYDRAYAVFIYSPLDLYAVNKEVKFVPQKCTSLRLKETSVTDNHWSVRPNNEAAKRAEGQTNR
jgi:peptide/nickel transport system substrate-binding protein